MLIKSLLAAAFLGVLVGVVTAHEPPATSTPAMTPLPDAPVPPRAATTPAEPAIPTSATNDGLTISFGQLGAFRLHGEQIQVTMSQNNSWSLELTGKATLEHGDMRVQAEQIRVCGGKPGADTFHLRGAAQYCEEQWRAEGETIELEVGQGMRIQGTEGQPARFQQLKGGKAITEVEGTSLELRLPQMEITGMRRLRFPSETVTMPVRPSSGNLAF